jgi:hypothetical protein
MGPMSTKLADSQDEGRETTYDIQHAQVMSG